jgi:glucose/arabinose dehydrogenase
MKTTLKIFLVLVLLVSCYLIYSYLNPDVTERTTSLSNIVTPPSATNSGAEVSSGTEVASGYEVVLVADGLSVPRAVAQTAPDRLLVTERAGRVRQIVDGVLWADPVLTLAEISNSAEEWLMSMILDPDYATNKRVYISYAYLSDTGMVVRVERYTDEGDRFTEPFVVWDMLPAARYHAGTALAFGPDGYLYITVGDATEATLAQAIDQYHGKILRINADGSIPEDNPFPDSAIWSLGHRNNQWIAWSTEGNMYASEHGPSTFDWPPGGDEINHILPWANYGRPVVSHEETRTDMISPLAIYTPAVAPASLMIYKWSMFPERQWAMFVGLLKGEGIIKLTLDETQTDAPRIVTTERPVDNTYGRIRFVGEWIDGSIYFTTSNEDGRGRRRSGGDGVYQIRRPQ